MTDQVSLLKLQYNSMTLADPSAPISGVVTNVTDGTNLTHATSAEVLIPSDGDDWQVGEVGQLVANDNPKFDICLLFTGMRKVKIKNRWVEIPRAFYFNSNEVRIL